MFVKTDVFDVTQKVKNSTKRSRAPKTDFVGQKQTGRARSEVKNTGVKKFSAFIWTFMATEEK